MIDEIDEIDILKPFAVDIAKRISQDCIKYLKGLKATLSGDDSGLVNVWNEICVQLQDEYSFFWDAYEETVRSFVAGHVAELQNHEKKALWIQTDDFLNWLEYDKQDDDNGVIIGNEDDIVRYIMHEYIYREGIDYDNDSIEQYKASRYGY